MKVLRLSLVAVTLLCLPHAAFASPINVGAYVLLPGLVTFEDVAGGAVDINTNTFGTNYNGILSSGGQTFAERFVGQTLGIATVGTDDFDTLSGSPSGPLTLQAGAANQNLTVYLDLDGNSLAGTGSQGLTIDGVGNGSIAMLFAADQSQFGFEVLAGNDGQGSATVLFFNRSGGLIDTAVLLSLGDPGFYGFTRAGGVRDIAGFSVVNNDFNGISFDNITFADPVPEPGTLMLVGVAGLFLVRRLKRSV